MTKFAGKIFVFLFHRCWNDVI